MDEAIKRGLSHIKGEITKAKNAGWSFPGEVDVENLLNFVDFDLDNRTTKEILEDVRNLAYEGATSPPSKYTGEVNVGRDEYRERKKTEKNRLKSLEKQYNEPDFEHGKPSEAIKSESSHIKSEIANAKNAGLSSSGEFDIEKPYKEYNESDFEQGKSSEETDSKDNFDYNNESDFEEDEYDFEPDIDQVEWKDIIDRANEAMNHIVDRLYSFNISYTQDKKWRTSTTYGHNKDNAQETLGDIINELFDIIDDGGLDPQTIIANEDAIMAALDELDGYIYSDQMHTCYSKILALLTGKPITPEDNERITQALSDDMGYMPIE